MPADGDALTGLGVLVTRPAHQAEGLCAAIEAAGGRAQRLPLLAIEGPADPATATARLRTGSTADGWIFTSPNAVRWAARLYPPNAGLGWPPVLAAAGHGTAAALSALGFDAVQVPDQQDGAAGLLELPLLRDAAHKRLLIICGERPLSKLANGLRERGGSAESVDVYRRRPLACPPAQVKEAIEAVDAAIVSSGESLRHLHALTPPEARTRLLALQLVAPSARVIELAEQLGFRHAPLLPDRVGDAGFTQALVRWRLATGQNRK